MKFSGLISLAFACHSTVVQACGGHKHEQREWTQEELDELERKWGTEVGWGRP